MIDLVFIPVPCVVFDESTEKAVLQVDQAAIMEQLAKTCEEIRATFEVQVDVLSYKESDKPCDVSVISLSGQEKQVVAARLWFLEHHARQESTTIQATAHYLFNANYQMKPPVKDELTEIMKATQTEIMVRLSDFSAFSPPLVALDSVGEVIIEIRGRRDNMEHGKLQTLLMLDKWQADLHCEEIKVEAKSVPYLCGRKRSFLNAIMEECLVNVYVPWLRLSPKDQPVTLYLSGAQKEAVLKAKGSLQRKLSGKISLTTKTFKFDTVKLSHILAYKARVFQDLMFKHAAFFVVNLTEQETSTIAISAEFVSSIDEACKAIIDLGADIFKLSFNLSAGLVTELSRKNVPRAGFTKRFSRMCQKSLGVIAISGSTIEIIGSGTAIAAAAKLIHDVDEIGQLLQSVHVSADMAGLYKEFITGKKNGKINKISKTTNTDVHLQEPEHHLLTVRINSSTLKGAMEAFSQLQDEIPAEMEFFIADTHHKRIIGVGGKSIQAIMKVYGVYVKFTSAEEFGVLGGIVPNDKNVLARTPAKNASNLVELYHSVMDLVNPKDKEYITLFTHVPRRYQRAVQVALKQQRKPHDDPAYIEVTFPTPESGAQKVTVRGLEKEIQKAFSQIRELTGDARQYSIPAYNKIEEILRCTEFLAFDNSISGKFKMRMKHGFNSSKTDYNFTFECNQNTSKMISTVVDALVAILKAKEVPIYNGSAGGDDLSEIKELIAENGAEGVAPAAQTDVVFFQSASSFNLGKNKAIDGVMQDRFVGSAPNLRQVYKAASEEKRKGKQAPIGTESSQKPSEASAANRVMSSAIHQITSLTGSMSLMAGNLSGMAAASKDNSIERASQSQGSTKKMPGPGDSPSAKKAAIFGPGSPEVPHLSLNTNFKDIPGDQPPFASPNEVDKSARGLLRINTLEVKNLDSNAELPSSQSFLSAIIQNILPLDTDNKLGIFLTQVELGKYQQTFADHDVDFEMFLKLTEDDFRELGITIGARKKLMAAIGEIRQIRRDGNQAPVAPTNNPSVAASNVATPVLPSGAKWANNQQQGNEWSTNSFGGTFPYMANVAVNKSFPPPAHGLVSPISPSTHLGFVDFIPGTAPSPSSPPGITATSWPKHTVEGAAPSSPVKDLNASGNNGVASSSRQNGTEEKHLSFFTYNL